MTTDSKNAVPTKIWIRFFASVLPIQHNQSRLKILAACLILVISKLKRFLPRTGV
jgi:hypothetical protein